MINAVNLGRIMPVEMFRCFYVADVGDDYILIGVLDDGTDVRIENVTNDFFSAYVSPIAATDEYGEHYCRHFENIRAAYLNLMRPGY